jgi:hypothetical protein
VLRVLLASTSIYLQGPEPPGEASLHNRGLYLVYDEVDDCVEVYRGPERSARDYAENVEKVNRAVTKALSRRRRLAPVSALLTRARQRRSSRPGGRTARWVSGKKRKRHRRSSDGDDPDLATAQSKTAITSAATAACAGSLASRTQDAARRSAPGAHNTSSRHIRALTGRARVQHDHGPRNHALSNSDPTEQLSAFLLGSTVCTRSRPVRAETAAPWWGGRLVCEPY